MSGYIFKGYQEMKKLILMRHAKSDWNTDAKSDRDRPLNKRGRRDAPAMGAWLNDNGYRPDRVFSSPSLRTRQTVELVMEELELKKKQVSWVEDLYHPGLSDMLKLLHEGQEDCQALMLVSHNPGLEELLLYLSRDTPVLSDSGKLLPTAAIAVLCCDAATWLTGEGSYSLESLVRPRELTD